MSRHFTLLIFLACAIQASPKTFADYVRDLQLGAERKKKVDWAHWGNNKGKYSEWTSHSNRLIPIYTFGMTLQEFVGRRSTYRNRLKLKSLYGEIPTGTLNPRAVYMDQTDVYQLQRQAIVAGKKYIILIVFDGMDWHTTRAAAIYKSQRVGYDSGRGSGLGFQDYLGATTDYGFFVSSPHNSGTNVNVSAQVVRNPGGKQSGGFSSRLGGKSPWSKSNNDQYLMGKSRNLPHVVTDSAASATSMFSGIKTYNGAINVNPWGKHVEPMARSLQRMRNFEIGIVTNVPISHATPAAAYANNVHRNDYQDLTRDLLGLRSISHRTDPLPGVDVLIGCGGWGTPVNDDDAQGHNFVPGNRYLTRRDLRVIDVENGGRYVVASRRKHQSGKETLLNAARIAHRDGVRLLGLFGTAVGNLPYQTADGGYDPIGRKYTKADLYENPTLADMTRCALGVLSNSKNGFWLLIEAGDVDWASHRNNIDNAIGSVLSGDDAFKMVIQWVESRHAWKDTALIVTADHGHYFVLDKPASLVGQ